MNLSFFVQVLFRLLLAVLVGGAIGYERARHGRTAGIRTHVMVCMGAALTTLCSIYVNDVLGNGGDMLRMSAQVISGIGFLGAGIIVLRNNTIIGLTTAAGVWITGVIGIAIGCGFYVGALCAAVLVVVALLFFKRLEHHQNKTQVFYLEVDDMSRANDVLDAARSVLGVEFSYRFLPPKSLYQGHLGIHLVVEKPQSVRPRDFLKIDHVLFAEMEEQLTKTN